MERMSHRRDGMITVHEQRESSNAARVMERALRVLLNNPSGFTYGALAVSTLFALPRGFSSQRDVLLFLGQLLIFGGWVQLWGRQRIKDPVAHSWWTLVLAFLGMLVLATLAARHLAFTLVATTLLPQYFTLLPLPVAVLTFFPMFVASEYSHTAAVLANPTTMPWDMAIIRGAAVILIGICFKVLALQIEERGRLRASLASAERKTGVLAERQRLAREIHDTLAQGFASILLHFERAEQIGALESSPAKPHLDLARSVAREGLEESRRMLAALRPEVLEQRALPEALERVCQEWSVRTKIEAKLSVTGSASALHPDIEVAVLRGMQEALTNVARHSGAKTAAVTLSYMDDVVVLDVQDDGKGFLPSEVQGNGYGLTGMRERVKRLRGSVSVESMPGEGTTISLSLPAMVTSTSEIVTSGLSA
jgi:signal transduction histidine kinase